MGRGPADLLEGTVVVDAAGEPAAMAGRILADLGAEVVKVGNPVGDPLRRLVWDRGCRRLEAPAPEEVTELLGRAALVIETPGWPECFILDPSLAPEAVWVTVTPFGSDGPRSHWRASDLGIMAASGNMHATGDPDRPPVRPSEPAAYAHAGPEIAFAGLTGLAGGVPQRIDVSLQEVVCVANMCAPARFAHAGEGFRRRGADVGRTREIWPCADGWVSFGLRGGKARVPSLETITRLCEEEGVATPALTGRDWASYSPAEATEAELRAIEAPVASYFARHTMEELYEIACETNLMLAPINAPKDIYASAQLAARDFFDEEGFPRSPVHVHRGPASDDVLDGGSGNSSRIHRQERARDPDKGAWAGTRIVEFGSGAAGPIVTRYFAEHGATVVRVESRSRPDFLRVYALGPGNPHGLEGSHMFDGLNAGKLSITLDLKHPGGVDLARRLAGWADAVVENFAPRAMRGFGLDYEMLAAEVPGLVMLSSCLNGQSGPHRDYPGFGGQGAALSGYNFLTGWPDREPVGPFGTITDSLAPRFGAATLAAALLRRRVRGHGCHLDLSQVEAAVYTLGPWLLRWRRHGEVRERMGNRHPDAVLHGAFPCSGEDSWVAIACWDDHEWTTLATMVGVDPSPAGAHDAGAQDAREHGVARWTATRSAEDAATELQAAGIEAVPVQDFAALLADPQLTHRGHFVTLEHPYLGEGPYERNGFRLERTPGGVDRPGPTLGEHTLLVLSSILGLSERDIHALQRSGALDYDEDSQSRPIVRGGQGRTFLPPYRADQGSRRGGGAT